jgi:hypothetical protein
MLRNSRRGAEIAEADVSHSEFRAGPTGSDFLFRTKTQSHEDVAIAAKRLLSFAQREIAMMDQKTVLRPRTGFFVALCLCAKQI